MRTFLKGFCIGLLCLSLLGLAWFLVLQPGLTNGEAQALKDEYTVQPLPGAFGSGERLCVFFFQGLCFSIGQPRLDYQKPEKSQ